MLSSRVLTTDDWQVWRALRLAALAGAPQAFHARLADWQGTGDTEDRWRGILAVPGSHNLAAVLDGRPVGIARGVPGADGVPEVHSVFVSQAARGHGAGDLLLGEVERWAAGTGASTLRLTVMTANASAIALYERNGFTVTARPVGEPAELVMTKPLGNGHNTDG